MMRIAFLNPPFKGRFSRASRSPAVTKGGTIYYPFWLTYAAGVAEADGNDVLLIDAPAVGLDNQDVVIVLVGTHPSAVPEETLKINNKIDAIAVEEYDYTIRDLVREFSGMKDLSKVNGLVFRDGDDIRHNESREKIEDLDSLPYVSSVYKKR